MRENHSDALMTRSQRALRGALIAIVLIPAVLVGVTVRAAAQVTEASQTTPVKKIEVGVGVVSDHSFKFGEYNGLHNDGALGISSFDFRGGAAYDSGSTWRWRMTGSNLGLETRNLFVELGKQGKFRFTFGYDELLANRSDTNQTFYLGAGSNVLTLPTNWIAPRVPQTANPGNLNFRSFDPITGAGSAYTAAGVLVAPTAAQLTTLGNIRAADLPDLYSLDLATKRVRVNAGFSYSPNEHWDIPLSFTHEHKTGHKALGAVSSQSSGDESVLIPDLIDYNTEQASAAVNYKLKKLFLTAGYYGSFFKNSVPSMTWQDPNNAAMSATMASMPGNQFHQFSLTAGYKIGDNAKLVVNGAYGRNTQNDAFLGPSTAANKQLAWGLPAGSLNGLVVTGSFNAKFTAKPARKWHLSAAYKFDNRDNQTPLNLYLFQDANETNSFYTTHSVSPFDGRYNLPADLGSNTNIYENRAYSKQIHQMNFQSENAVAKRQYLTAGYDWQRITRSCPGSWINCADSPVTNEQTMRGEWRGNGLGKITARMGYAYSQRRGNYDENAFLALVPMANMVPTGATMSVYDYMTQNGLTGFGPLAGAPTTALTGNASLFTPNNNSFANSYYGSRNQVNELFGMRRYYVANRNRHKVRSSIDWQATQRISVNATGDFNHDNYLDSTYGLQTGTSWEATTDLSYAANENFVVDVFYTYDDQRFGSAGDTYGSNSTATFLNKAGNTVVDGSCFTTVAARNANAKLDPCVNWSRDSRDKIDTIGLSIRRKNLAGGKIELASEIMFTRARSKTAVNGANYVNNPLALAGAPALPAGTPAIFLVSGSDYPYIRSDEIMVRPSVTYALNKSTLFRASYMFQRLSSTDWGYLGVQFGSGAGYFPTQEQPPTYGIHAAGFSMLYTF